MMWVEHPAVPRKGGGADRPQPVLWQLLHGRHVASPLLPLADGWPCVRPGCKAMFDSCLCAGRACNLANGAAAGRPPMHTVVAACPAVLQEDEDGGDKRRKKRNVFIDDIAEVDDDDEEEEIEVRRSPAACGAVPPRPPACAAPQPRAGGRTAAAPCTHTTPAAGSASAVCTLPARLPTALDHPALGARLPAGQRRTTPRT